MKTFTKTGMEGAGHMAELIHLTAGKLLERTAKLFRIMKRLFTLSAAFVIRMPSLTGYAGKPQKG